MKTKKTALLAMIAALYTAVSLILAPFSFAGIQVRVAEALTMLPVIMPGSIYAVTLGCFLTNLIGALSGANILGFFDVFAGTLTTFVAAVTSYKLAKYKIKGHCIYSTLPPIFLNALVIGIELTFVLAPGNKFLWPFFWLMFFQVACGQFIAVFILGLPLINKLKDRELLKNI